MQDNLLELDNIPESGRTIHIPGKFLMSDNLEGAGGIEFINSPEISGMLHKHPFKLKFTMMLICVAGSMKLRIQMREHLLTPGNVFIMIEGGTGECIEIDPDARLAMMAFSKDFNILETRIKISSEFFASLAKKPMIPLSETEMANMLSIYAMLHERLSSPDFKVGEELAANCMRTLFYYISTDITENDPQLDKNPSRKQIIFDDFLNLVEEHFHTHREIAYYASRLYITPGYLSRVVLETSGHAAKEYIRMRIILEAKILLNEHRRTIQQISEALNFPNQSFFGTYFKKATGMSPAHYRLKSANRT